LSVSFSDVQGGWTGPGSGNIEADPVFVDAGASNFRLSADPPSPAVNAGSNDAVPSDTFDVDQDMNAAEKTPDRDIEERIVGRFVDMGAYEQPDNAENCEADVTEDGVVDVEDLVAVILGWGSCPPPPEACPEDANGDGVVDVQDLVGVILNWGAECALQSAPQTFWQCIERCGPTDPACIVTCGEMFGLFGPP
jgi:hypothetical protein